MLNEHVYILHHITLKDKYFTKQLITVWMIVVYWEVMLSHWVSGFHCFQRMGHQHLQVFKAC